MWLGQGYLVVVSVTVAYLLTNISATTGWVLLVVLAFYDLCAVLTPVRRRGRAETREQSGGAGTGEQGRRKRGRWAAWRTDARTATEATDGGKACERAGAWGEWERDAARWDRSAEALT